MGSRFTALDDEIIVINDTEEEIIHEINKNKCTTNMGADMRNEQYSACNLNIPKKRGENSKGTANMKQMDKVVGKYKIKKKDCNTPILLR